MAAAPSCEDCPHMVGCGIRGALCAAPGRDIRAIDVDYADLEKDEVDFTTPSWCPLEEDE